MRPVLRSQLKRSSIIYLAKMEHFYDSVTKLFSKSDDSISSASDYVIANENDIEDFETSQADSNDTRQNLESSFSSEDSFYILDGENDSCGEKTKEVDELEDQLLINSENHSNDDTKISLNDDTNAVWYNNTMYESTSSKDTDVVSVDKSVVSDCIEVYEVNEQDKLSIIDDHFKAPQVNIEEEPVERNIQTEVSRENNEMKSTKNNGQAEEKSTNSNNQSEENRFSFSDWLEMVENPLHSNDDKSQKENTPLTTKSNKLTSTVRPLTPHQCGNPYCVVIEINDKETTTSADSPPHQVEEQENPFNHKRLDTAVKQILEKYKNDLAISQQQLLDAATYCTILRDLLSQEKNISDVALGYYDHVFNKLLERLRIRYNTFGSEEQNLNYALKKMHCQDNYYVQMWNSMVDRIYFLEKELSNMRKCDIGQKINAQHNLVMEKILDDKFQLETENTALKSQIHEMTKQMEKLKTDLETQKDMYEKKVETVADMMSEELDYLEKKKNAEAKDLKVQVHDMKMQVEVVKLNFDAQMETKEKSIASLKEEYAKLEAAQKELISDLEQLTLENKTLQLSEDQRLRMYTYVQNIERKNSDLVEQQTSLLKEIETLKTHLLKTQKEYDDVNTVLHNTLEANRELSIKNTNLMRQMVDYDHYKNQCVEHENRLYEMIENENRYLDTINDLSRHTANLTNQ